MGVEAHELDFITRLANAWDGRGPVALSVAEQRALWELAYLSAVISDALPSWGALSGEQRRRLVTAGRAAIRLGQTCGGLFGG